VTTVTSVTLLEGLRNPRDDGAWQRFTQRYQPMVLAFATKLGLDDADAQDASQETMLAFVTGYRAGAYQQQKGRLRSWLFGVAYHKVRGIQRRRGRERALADYSDGTSLLAAVGSPDGAEDLWQVEWERAVLRACMAEAAQHFDAATLQAFELYVLDEVPADDVAHRLGLSRNAVYVGKNRVLTRLRELRQQMEEIW